MFYICKFNGKILKMVKRIEGKEASILLVDLDTKMNRMYFEKDLIPVSWN